MMQLRARSLAVLDVLATPTIVYFYDYYIRDTYDDVHVRRNMEKTIPEVMADINLSFWGGCDTLSIIHSKLSGDFSSC